MNLNLRRSLKSAAVAQPTRSWTRQNRTSASLTRPAAASSASPPGREDHAKQIWQLLTMELWYRNVRSMGVAA